MAERFWALTAEGPAAPVGARGWIAWVMGRQWRKVLGIVLTIWALALAAWSPAPPAEGLAADFW